MNAQPQLVPAADAFGDVLRACTSSMEALAQEGLPAAPMRGQLIRPLIARASAGSVADERFWLAALAVQYAHEASLLHDDVIDGALQRRGEPTRVAARGVAAALVEGDHLLTTAYRLAARTGSLAFAELFARAVERTVAGERLQGSQRGMLLTWEQYLNVVRGKSGELLGAAFAAAPMLRGDVAALQFYEVGRRVGVCYQMVDDLLDYCTAAATGKPALADFRQRIWTWPLAQLRDFHWEMDESRVMHALATSAGGAVPLHAALAALRETITDTHAEVRALVPDDAIVGALLCGWLERAETAVQATIAAHASLPNPPGMPDDRQIDEFFARNSRSFSFAARLFPLSERARVADVYAFCRVTDDLADAHEANNTDRSGRLDAWLTLCRDGYRGKATGSATLDRVLRDAADSGVPFHYIEQLIEGMRMDLAPRRYASLAELHVYTYRVASVVGLWLTRLWGVRDDTVLERAADLGHAMQLTNILRDVGEDWRAGRLYLPLDVLARHGVDEAMIASMVDGAPVTAQWQSMLEELMSAADTHYERAFAAIPALPRRVRAAVAAAASVYRGIHAEIRRNGYDNCTRRARTSFTRKVWLVCTALLQLTRTRRTRSLKSRWQRAPRLALLLLMLASVHTTAAFAQSPELLEQLRHSYHLAVEEESALGDAERTLQQLLAEAPASAQHDAPLLHAYQGALRLLRAKYGAWPPARLSNANQGLRLLDAAVQQAPDHIEVRYLRLVTGYHLPGFFRRGSQVREDFQTLALLVPARAAAHPREVARAAAAFVLTHGDLEPAVRASLERWHADHG